MADIATLSNNPFLDTTTPSKPEIRVRPVGGHMGDIGFEMDDEPSAPNLPGLRAGELFFGALGPAPDQKFKRVVEIGRDTVDAATDLWKNYISEHQPTEPPKTEKEQTQTAEFNFTQQKNQETEAAMQRVTQEKEEMEDVRAGLAGMSGDQRAEKAGVQTGFRAWESLRNAYTRSFTFLKEKWSAIEEARKDRSAFELQGQRSVDLSKNLLAQEGQSQVANQIMGAG